MDPKTQPGNSLQWISIFPLPSTVFFPSTDLPLHIFEPRYRQMVKDALNEDLKIGMVLLKPGWEASYFAKPEIASIGCVGTIDRYTCLPDGKYNILLKGISRFRIIKEFGGRPYRRTEIEELKEINNECLLGEKNPIKDELIEHAHEFIRLLPGSKPDKIDNILNSCKLMSQLVDQLAYRLDLTVEQKQSFLEEMDVLRRVDFIHSVLKMKIDLIHMSKVRIKKGSDVRLN